MRQNKKHFYIDEIEPNVFEANFDGSSICALTIPEKSEWDPSLPIEEILICAVRPQKKGLKTKIKSITLIK